VAPDLFREQVIARPTTNQYELASQAAQGRKSGPGAGRASASSAPMSRASAIDGLRRAVLDDRDGPLPALLLALTVVAGVLDATTILRLGHVFVSTITGNIVFLGLAASGARGFAVITSALAIGGFIVGVLVGGQTCRVARAHRGRALRNVLGIKCVLAAAVTLVVFLADSRFSDAVVYTVLVLLAMSMGAQLAVIRYLKIPDLLTVVLTLTITGALTEHGTRWDEPAVLRRALAIAAFAVGVLSGALLALYVTVGAALSLGLGLIVVTAIAAHVVSREEVSWSQPHSA
jgi:uncharacterized membrane protein YoaK (UPF0700 family)